MWDELEKRVRDLSLSLELLDLEITHTFLVAIR